MKELIKTLLSEHKYLYPENAPFQFEAFYEELKEWNNKFNLTRIIEKDDVAHKHFLDSVAPINLIKENAKLIDIGAGAGFPSIPIKIMRPDINVHLVDSLNKRVGFLNEVIKKLGLTKITATHCRAEDIAHKTDMREQFDVCVARAVAGLNILTEYCLPFIKQGGIFIAYKSKDCEQELEAAQKAVSILGGKVEAVHSYNTDKNTENKLIIIRKIAPSNAKYPRGKNLPRTAPII